MNKLRKIAVVAAVAALAVQGAFAGANNNNLVLSINNNDGGGNTEFTVNLGQISTFTPIPNYDLSGFMSTFNSQYASAAASGLNVGVAGGQNGQGGLSGAGNDVFTTTLRVGGSSYTTAGTESAPTPATPSKANIGNAGGIAGGVVSFGSNLSTGDANSFTTLFAKDPTTTGTAANSFTSFLGGDNPLQTMTGTSIVLDLWKDTVTSSGTTGWAYQGDFTLDLSGAQPSLVFDAAPVPEPSTYGLFAGAGILALSLRRQFRSKNA